MRLQNGTQEFCAKFIQSVWAESWASPQISVHSNWISCVSLAQFPRLPFCGLIYIQLLLICSPIMAEKAQRFCSTLWAVVF